MNFLKKLLEPTTNAPEIAILIVQLIKAKISKTTLKREIEEHPNYPSLLSISDVFTSHGIENIAVKVDAGKLANTSDPFIIQLNGSGGEATFFSVVREIKNDKIIYFDPEKHFWSVLTKEEFIKKTTGVILLVSQGESVYEEDYKKKIKMEKQKRTVQYMSVFCVPVICFSSGIFYYLKNGTSVILPAIFLLLTLIGSGIGVLLLWYELDKHNPALSQICTAGKKVNCGSILQSNASKIAGISWSSIGLSYFVGLLLLLVFGGLDNKEVLFLAAWGSLPTIPYMAFSIYYQSVIAKQWCILCLGALTVLALQTSVSIIAGWHTIINVNMLNFSQLTQYIAAFILPLILINILITAFQKGKEGRKNFISLQKLKNNPYVFNTLLKKEKELGESPEHLGITLGNPNAKYKILKVCNPYCGPCANAHKPMEELLKYNEDVQIQILFTATNEKYDIKTPPVKHFLALSEKYGEEKLQKALDDWYLSDEKNYEAFATKYPMQEELERQGTRIDLMKNWCDKVQIKFTPTFFISMDEDGNNKSPKYFQMPEIYTASDLKYFFLK